MRFGRDDVRRVAELARLSLSDAELDRFAGQLADVLEHVAALDAVDVDVETTPATPSALRPDREAFDRPARPPASFAPDFTDGFFAVPRLAAFDPERDVPDREA